MGLNQTCIRIGESGISTQLSLEEPEFQFISGLMDENHPREPVYDSSPPAVEKFHTFSSISSDLQTDTSETGPPPILVESADGHSKLHVERTQTGINSHEGVPVTSSQVHLIDANESRSSEVPEVHEHDVKKDESSGVNANRDNGEETMVPESRVDHVAVDSGSFSEAASTEELAVANEGAIHPEGEQVHSSSSSDNEEIQEAMTHEDENVQPHLEKYQSPSYNFQIHVGGHDDVGQKVDDLGSSDMQMPSDKLNLSASEESVHVVAAVQEPLSSSNSDASVHAGVNQDKDVKILPLDSNSLNMLPGEHSEGVLEKQPSWLDKSVVDPLIVVHDQLQVVQEQYKVLVDSPREVDVIKNENVQELHDPDYEVSNSNSTLVPSESSSDRPFAGVVDLENKILDSIVYEDGSHVSEDLHYSMEKYGPPVEQNVTGEADELRDIDEGFLSELDTIGDFRVNEVAGPRHDEQIPEETSFGSHKNDLLLEDSDLRDASKELPVLEVRSIEDIHLAFMQLHEGTDVKEVIHPSLVEDRAVVVESEHHRQINSGLPVFEARSVEDIDAAIKKACEANVEGMPKSLGSKDGLAEGIEPDDTQQIESTDIEYVVQETRVLASSEKKT
ncbi:hypothetical protein HS088_TW15G00704 [Tripterygium wilfordii]|uniref:Uncharacterized protein n=1 Tax=Tripterygium wilfordii TaxID=458696 RepID=A0A7J7CMC4_TRIWF|nr:hypothetical protein HS088_TW15G00704 [Tripterygium wilfordii]